MVGQDDPGDDPLFSALSQEWLTRRFGPIEPENLGRKVGICSLAQLTPPPAWRGVWTTLDGDGDPRLETCFTEGAGLEAVLLLCNPFDEHQARSLMKIVQSYYSACGLDGPVLIWVPHTLAPEVGMDTGQDIAKLSTHVLQAGLDALLEDEPEGLKLALALQIKIAGLEILAEKAMHQLQRGVAMQDSALVLRGSLNDLLWDYVRTRSAPSIPKADPQIPDGAVTQLAGFDMGMLLGKGTFGSVRLLMASGAAAPEDRLRHMGERPYAVKIVDKSTLLSVACIQKAHREIDIMSKFSGEWRHPNIVGLHKVLCSKTHVFLIMDYAGSLNLYRRLVRRDVTGPQNKPLSAAQSRSVMEQAIAAVGHLHLGPQVCHRDLKPENFVVDEMDDGPIVVKLTDFDVSSEHRTGLPCQSVCGTLPFIAPEVLLQKAYDGKAADVWSLAVVLLEVLCCARILERAVGFAFSSEGAAPMREAAQEIAARFSDSGMVAEILSFYTRAELVGIQAAALPILQGMLTVDVRQRWDIHQVVTAVQTFDLVATANT